jgi:hypothetical protein
MKIFRLNRIKDPSGISGLGIVAYGYEFENGRVAYTWHTEYATISIADSLTVVEKLHGHNGDTIIEIFDTKKYGRSYKSIQKFINGEDLKIKES